MKQELHCSLYSFCLTCAEQLFVKFPEQSFQEFQSIMSELEQVGYNTPHLDKVLAILGIVPRAFAKLQIDSQKIKQIINVHPVLGYLRASKNHRRLVILFNRFFKTFNGPELNAIFLQVFQLLNESKDKIVQFQCLMFIDQVMESNANVQELTDLIPKIVKLLQELQQPNTIWPLL